MGSPYQSQSASGYNSSPPPDDGTTVSANKITWAGIKSKLADSIKTLADAINTALRTALNVTPSTTSVNYTTLVGDHLTTIEVTGTTSISLGDAATMVAQSMGYTVTVYNKGVLLVTVALITAANTLNGTAAGSMILSPGQSATFTVNQAGNGYDLVSMSDNGQSVFAVAAGTADAITAAYKPVNLALFDGMLLAFRASAANATTTPTFSPDGLTAHTITRSGGTALIIGDIPGALAECIVRYNSANTRWELLNPGRSLKLKMVSFTHDVSVTGSQSVTGVGYVPNALILIANINGNAGFSIGLVDSATLQNNSIGNDYLDAVGTFAVQANQGVFVIPAAGKSATFAVTTMDADGFTGTWAKTSTPTGTATIYALALR